MQSNPRRDRWNVGEGNLNIVEKRKLSKGRWNRNGGRKPKKAYRQ